MNWPEDGDGWGGGPGHAGADGSGTNPWATPDAASTPHGAPSDEQAEWQQPWRAPGDSGAATTDASGWDPPRPTATGWESAAPDGWGGAAASASGGDAIGWGGHGRDDPLGGLGASGRDQTPLAQLPPPQWPPASGAAGVAGFDAAGAPGRRWSGGKIAALVVGILVLLLLASGITAAVLVATVSSSASGSVEDGTVIPPQPGPVPVPVPPGLPPAPQPPAPPVFQDPGGDRDAVHAAVQRTLETIDGSERAMMTFQDAYAAALPLDPSGEDIDPESAINAARVGIESLEARRRELAVDLGPGAEFNGIDAIRAAYLDHLGAWVAWMQAVRENPGVLFQPEAEPLNEDISATADVFANALELDLPDDTPGAARDLAEEILDRGFRPQPASDGPSGPSV